MRGHEALLTMRRAGAAPSLVMLDTMPCPLASWRDWQHIDPTIAHLQLDAEDRPQRLDLRCVVALTVMVSGTDAELVQATAQACEAAGAKRVIAHAYRPTGSGDLIDAEPIFTTDTQGQLTWPG
jgi:hypothetical protein